MASDACERTAHIYGLNMRYKDCLHKAAILHRDEELRRASLRALLFKDENAELHYDLGDKISYIESLASTASLMRQDLVDAQALARDRDAAMKKHDLELRSLKVEVQALRSSSRQSDNAINEKAALTRELNRLQPEVEELRAKLASHQATVAANGDLERQLNSLEVELENEKRAKQRLETKANGDDSRVVRELRAKLGQVENSLKKERKEREKLSKELSEAVAQRERQEGRTASSMAKVNEAQSTAKKSEQKAEGESLNSGTQVDQARGRRQKNKPVAPKGQAAPTMPIAETSFEDITIQTPGNDLQSEKRAVTKRGGPAAAILGKKSTFSITPFLNKTKDFAHVTHDEHPKLSTSISIAEDENIAGSPEILGEDGSDTFDDSPSITAKSSNGTRRKPRQPKKKGLAEASDSEVNRSILRISKGALKAGPKKRVRLGAVTDAEPVHFEQENSAPGNPEKEQASLEAELPATREPSPIARQPDADSKTKKRKLLGTTAIPMLEDDDALEQAQPIDAPVRGGPAKRIKAPLGGGVTNAFAGTGKAFSPLKRHRRGVNASFLA